MLRTVFAGIIGAVSAGLLFGIAATIYAEIGRSLHPPFEDMGYGIFVGICVLAAVIGGAIAGVAAVLMRGKARFVIPAVLGAGAGIAFSIAEPLAVRGGSDAQNTLAMVGGVLGFGSVGAIIGCFVAWVCGVVCRLAGVLALTKQSGKPS